MTETDNDHTPDEVSIYDTSVLGAGFNEQDASAVGAESAASGFEGMPAGSGVLVVKRGPHAGSRFWLDRPVTSAGRNPDSDVFLDDITVSRRHAEFRCDNGQFHVVDLGSLNGTYLNREPAGSAVLTNGDEIWIGKFRLVYLTGPTTDTQSGSGQQATEHEGPRLRGFNTQPELNRELEDRPTQSAALKVSP